MQRHPGDSPVSRTWMTGFPEISESVAEDSPAIGLTARKTGLETLLALPILENGRLKAVVAFVFWSAGLVSSRRPSPHVH